MRYFLSAFIVLALTITEAATAEDLRLVILKKGEIAHFKISESSRQVRMSSLNGKWKSVAGGLKCIADQPPLNCIATCHATLEVLSHLQINDYAIPIERYENVLRNGGSRCGSPDVLTNADLNDLRSMSFARSDAAILQDIRDVQEGRIFPEERGEYVRYFVKHLLLQIHPADGRVLNFKVVKVESI